MKEANNIYQLKQTLYAGTELSIDEICSLCCVKRSRAYDYLIQLESEGFHLISYRKSRKSIYKYSNCDSDSALYIPLDNNHINIFKILTVLSKSPMIAQDIYDNLGGDDFMPISSYYVLIERMLSSQLIVSSTRYERPTQKSLREYKRIYLYPTGLYCSLLLSLTIDGQSIINTAVSEAQPQAKALTSIYRKVALLDGYNSSLPSDNSLFIQYGRGYEVDSKLATFYTALNINHFTTNILSFDYKGNSIKFATGMVVYVQDKDELYLVGRKIGTHNSSIIKFSEINNLTYTSENNNEYNAKKYYEYLTNMFSISVEVPHEVEIRFHYSENNLIRLDKLCRLRINAQLHIEYDSIVFTDTISGLHDFANYLRTYGNSYTIIKPQLLSDMLKTTFTRALERYTDEKI